MNLKNYINDDVTFDGFLNNIIERKKQNDDAIIIPMLELSYVYIVIWKNWKGQYKLWRKKTKRYSKVYSILTLKQWIWIVKYT
jgi:ATP adenylyltransferase/5',5'''-P-1,P-4-tetraphosphate phosphorylase II